MKNPNIRVIPAQQAWGLPNFMPFGPYSPLHTLYYFSSTT